MLPSPTAKSFPSGEKATQLILLSPLRVDWHSKVPAEPTAHIFIVLSLLPVASLVPLLFHDTERTLRFQ